MNDSLRIIIYGVYVFLFMCELIKKKTHTHTPPYLICQKKQLPTVLFCGALFAIPVTGKAPASLSDFYEHSCWDY